MYNNKLSNKKILKFSPQKKGIILKILNMKPKKPNSAIRKVAKLKIFFNNKANIVLAYIPGISHNLTLHSQVLIEGGKIQDLPGVNYKIIRGSLDCSGVNRKTSRSKYGCKKS